MIVVEGPDGAGKTTLVKDIMETFEIGIGRRGTEDRSKLYTVTRADTYRAVAEDIHLEHGCQVWDRLFYSEMIYAPLGMPPRKPKFTFQDQLVIGHLLRGAAVTVVCYPPLNVVVSNVVGTDQMSGVHENIEKIWEAYGKLQPANAIWYDYTEEQEGAGYVTHGTLMRMLLTHINQRTERLP